MRLGMDGISALVRLLIRCWAGLVSSPWVGVFLCSSRARWGSSCLPWRLHDLLWLTSLFSFDFLIALWVVHARIFILCRSLWNLVRTDMVRCPRCICQEFHTWGSGVSAWNMTLWCRADQSPRMWSSIPEQSDITGLCRWIGPPQPLPMDGLAFHEVP